MRLYWLVAISVCAAATPALAQGPFVGVSLTGDIVRFSHAGSEGARDASTGGEAVGFALRAGTPLGAAWGVDAEFVRPAAIENEGVPGVIPLANWQLGLIEPAGREGLTAAELGLVIYPPLWPRIRTWHRNTTFAAGLWARQAISARAALVYSGGAAFHRTARDIEWSYQGIERLAAAPFILPRELRTESISYSTRPYAGIEARIGMTRQLELVPAVRVHGLEDGVVVRPAIGLAWSF